VGFIRHVKFHPKHYKSLLLSIFIALDRGLHPTRQISSKTLQKFITKHFIAHDHGLHPTCQISSKTLQKFITKHFHCQTWGGY
jgi:hypothetical protein